MKNGLFKKSVDFLNSPAFIYMNFSVLFFIRAEALRF